jgi:hypothetical protein
MSHHRVIQDSDDDDDPLAADFPPPANPPHQTDNTLTLNSDIQSIPVRAQVREPNHPITINFDEFLQSQEAAPTGPSSSQQRREERWIPNEVGGGGSIGEQSSLSEAYSIYLTNNVRVNDDGDWPCTATTFR